MAAPPAKKGRTNAVVEEKESTTITMVVKEFEEGQDEQFSPIYRIKGFPFRLRMVPHWIGSRGPYIECIKSNEVELWKCTTTVQKNLNRPRGLGKEGFELVFCSWDEDPKGLDFGSSMTYEVGKSVQVTIAVKEGPSRWTSPTLRPPLESINPHNGIIMIGEEEKEIQVNKEFLAAQSPYFDRLFKEDNIDKIPIGDVEYEEFNNIIKMVYGTFSRPRWYPGLPLLKEKNVLRVLELADRFELKIVKDILTSDLISCYGSSISLALKLLLSEKRNVPFLKKFCLETSKKDQLFRVKESPEYADFSEELKAEILDRMQNDE